MFFTSSFWESFGEFSFGANQIRLNIYHQSFFAQHNLEEVITTATQISEIFVDDSRFFPSVEVLKSAMHLKVFHITMREPLLSVIGIEELRDLMKCRRKDFELHTSDFSWTKKIQRKEHTELLKELHEEFPRLWIAN